MMELLNSSIQVAEQALLKSRLRNKWRMTPDNWLKLGRLPKQDQAKAIMEGVATLRRLYDLYTLDQMRKAREWWAEFGVIHHEVQPHGTDGGKYVWWFRPELSDQEIHEALDCAGFYPEGYHLRGCTHDCTGSWFCDQIRINRKKNYTRVTQCYHYDV